MFTKENLQKQLLLRIKERYTQEESVKQKAITKVIEQTPEIMPLIESMIIRGLNAAKGDIALLLSLVTSSCFVAGISLGYAMGVEEKDDKSSIIP